MFLRIARTVLFYSIYISLKITFFLHLLDRWGRKKKHIFWTLSQPNTLIEYVEFFIFIILSRPVVGLRDLQQSERCLSCPKCNLRHKLTRCYRPKAPHDKHPYLLLFSSNRFINLRTTQTTISRANQRNALHFKHLWMMPQNKLRLSRVKLRVESKVGLCAIR